ncbi:hypothetical protein IB256_09820 [Pseudomonas sp. PDM17]|uniref:hypothetical protein n=1 Tax=Pseudomonas sp. PDM17 TaxID=2769285 RepID=UPI00177CB937|nr:hypothetical protein [Pseudomonas sp. PDM17]MBD9501075.1 hypothetical protein [Pseudomonas sp. PDM17]
MSYFIVHRDHNVILGTADVIYTSFNSYFVEANEAQVEAYEKLAATLPTDHYVELSDIIRPSRQLKSQSEGHKPATPEFRKSIAGMFRQKGK